MDASLPPILEVFEENIETRRKSMLVSLISHDWCTVFKVPENPHKKIRALAASQLRVSRTFARAADKERKKELTIVRDELVARQNLSKSLDAVLALLQRMKDKATLEKCKPSLRTKPISDKSKEFASKAVTKELKKALDREFKALGIEHIKTKLRERNERGKMFHQLLLDLPTTKKLDEILSEGEQRAIALGAFLAELSLANHTCGIVFDDPVSSLDHWRRRDVAKRLVDEAIRRQVIIFTHDTSFLGQLCDEIDEIGLPNSMLFLEWFGNFPGQVNGGLPWDHQGYKERIDVLEQEQSKLAKTWPVYPGESERAKMRQQYDRLRATLERVIQDVVFNGVMKRYRDWIRVSNLVEVVGFEPSEFEAIDKLHKRCSDVVTSHDPSSEKAAPVPSAKNLADDIRKLKILVDGIKQRRKAVKAVT